MRQENIPAIPLQTVISSQVVNSAAIPALNLFYASAQLVATTGASGTFKMQASNDDSESAPQPFVPSNWSDIPGATVAVAGAGAYLIPQQNLCYQYVRLVYTSTGAGTISAIFKALGQ